jgi:BolA protein
MPLKQWITGALTERLQPASLSVTDESHQHAGHAGWREGGETHFRIDIASEVFAGKSRVERHRLVNAAIAEAFDRGCTRWRSRRKRRGRHSPQVANDRLPHRAPARSRNSPQRRRHVEDAAELRVGDLHVAASSQSCMAVSACMETPVAPIGWPLALRPPDGLTGSRPSFWVQPS